MRAVTTYEHHTGKLSRPYTLMVISDLHNESYHDLLPLLKGADALLVPGDVSDRYRQRAETGIAFLHDAAKLVPTFYSVGNHETRQKRYREIVEAMAQTGAEILINRYVRFEELWIGGWYDPEIVGKPDILEEFEQLEGAKVLLCHKPEHFAKYILGRDIDLVVAGHAHGGQLRIGGRGMYAPGQGLLPRYTRGKYHERLIVSAGAGNPARMPRWGNPCEVLKIVMD